MKLFLLSIIAYVAVAEAEEGVTGGAARPVAEEACVEQLVAPRPKLFEDVFGAAADHPARAVSNRAIKPEPFFAVRSEGNCTFPLDVVIVQDSTGSFTDDFDPMRTIQLKQMTEVLDVWHPGSRYGVVSFRDKPVPTLGEPFDYCHRYDLPLGEANYNDLYEAYGKLWANGGLDPAENQLGAIIAALESPEIGWQNNSLATRLIVLSTDSWPHFEGDGLNAYGMTPNTGHLETADEAGQCVEQYYPSPAQVRDVILQAEAKVAFLVFDGNYAGGRVLNSWEWFNQFLGQGPAYVEPLANDSSNFWESLSRVITSLEIEECGIPVITTAPPLPTAPPTTTACATGEDCCPEVQIRLRHRPAQMHLEVEH